MMLTLKEGSKDGWHLIELSGRIQQDDVALFEQALEKALQEKKYRLLVDMASITHVCSAALGILVAFKHRLRKEDFELRLVVSGGELRALFEMTMMDRLFSIFRSQEEAVAHGRRSPS